VPLQAAGPFVPGFLLAVDFRRMRGVPVLNINVTVRDVALNISRDITIAVDDQLPVGELTSLLIQKLAWPQKDIEGQAVLYALCLQRGTDLARLPADAPVASVGILNGSVLVIGPVSTPMSERYSAPPEPASTTPETAGEPAPHYTMKPLQRR
jgi:hypothetical protein